MKNLYGIALVLVLALSVYPVAAQQRSTMLAAGPSNGSGTCPLSTTVGGVAVGSAGASSIYSGHILSWGDEFDCLSIVGPPSPKGTYFTTELYGGFGRRGTTTLLGTQYDTDQLHTGYLDINRGVPVGWNNLRVSNSTLIMQARQATTREQANAQLTDPSINGGVRAQVGTTLTSAGNIYFYPSTASVILEWRVKFSLGCCGGWHPDLWSSFATPSVVSVIAGANGNQWNLCEGNTTSCQPSDLLYTNGSFAAVATQTQTALYDGNFHVISIVFVNGANTVIYLDCPSVCTAINTFAFDSNTGGGFPFYWLLTSHVYNASWLGENYNAAAWAASGTGPTSGAAITIDWARVWRPATATGHFVPGATISDLLVDYAGSGSIVLPSSASLWPLGATAENVQIAPAEVNEPGNGVQSTYFQFPPGVTYNSGTRTISVNFSGVGGNAGVMHGLDYGWVPDGSTGQPARFTITRGPNFTQLTGGVSLNVPISFDMYPTCDVGIATPKTMTMSGLPAGLSFDPSSFRVRGTLTTFTGATATASCTNNVGQSQTVTFTFVQSGYQGIGDAVPGAQFYGSVARAYNQTYANANSPAYIVCDVTLATCTTINILTNGNADTATAAATTQCATTCYVKQLYEQVGGTNHWTCTSGQCPVLKFNCKGTLPCIESQSLITGLVAGNVTPATGVASLGVVAERASGTTALRINSQNANNRWIYTGSANSWTFDGGTSGSIVVTAGDAALHAGIGVIGSGAGASVVNLDGGETTGTLVGSAAAGTPQVGLGVVSQTAYAMETWAYDNVILSPSQRSSLHTNMSTYYGTP